MTYRRRRRGRRHDPSLVAVGLALMAFALVALAAFARDGDEPERGTGVTPAEALGLERLPRLDRPNVVVVQTDDQRHDSLRAMPRVRELLAAEGTTFANYLATFPLCCPSRATLLTGEYSHNHGVLSNVGENGGYEALDHATTLPVWLQAAGYHTGHVGKYLNGYRGAAGGAVPPGWDEWYTALGGGRMYDYRLSERGSADTAPRIVKYGSAPADYGTDVFADKALDFIRRSARSPQPFFLLLDTLAPHQENIGFRGRRNPRPARRHLGEARGVQLPRPPGFNERLVADKPGFVRRKPPLSRRTLERMARAHRSRLESLLAVDEAVGRIVRSLELAGELDDTLIVFVSDNGYLLGEHRLIRGKKDLYEASARAPLVVRGPGFRAGVTDEGLTGNVDLAPTILELTSAEPSGRTLDGVSLAGRTPQARDRALVLENGDGGSSGVRTSRWSYIVHPTEEVELYDIRADPGQLVSLHDSRAHRRVERRLAALLERLHDCAGVECRVGRG